MYMCIKPTVYYLKHTCTCILYFLFPLVQNHVAVWSGKKLEVYVISADKPTVRDAGKYMYMQASDAMYCRMGHFHTCIKNFRCVVFASKVKQVESLDLTFVQGSDCQ